MKPFAVPPTRKLRNQKNAVDKMFHAHKKTVEADIEADGLPDGVKNKGKYIDDTAHRMTYDV